MPQFDAQRCKTFVTVCYISFLPPWHNTVSRRL